MLKIYNSLTRTKEEFVPLRPPHVGMYVCGMTVYDYCHLGHARVLVVFDIVQRWLRASEYEVNYVRNITDIDDKIIRRASERGESVEMLTEYFIKAMHEDAAKLGVQSPDHEPRATRYIPQMKDLIGKLKDRGMAYAAVNGDVNFAVRKFPRYGKLSGKSLDELRAGARVGIEATKHDPLDFVLWKQAKEGEPSWQSQWGKGRPGWHIECSAMSMKLLGKHFDIHGGGQDLQFPHHENEIAQSEGATGDRRPFVRYWMHNGFVRVNEEKMSKSLGNFFTVRDVLKRHRAEVLRFFILRTHYRSPLDFWDGDETLRPPLVEAREQLTRLYTTLRNTAPDNVEVNWNEIHGRRFRQAMNDDFNTPEAVTVLFDLASEINRTRSHIMAGQLRALGGLLGILQTDPEEFFKSSQVRKLEVHLDDARVDELVQERVALKAKKDYKNADRIREELRLFGVLIDDGIDKTEWRRASGFRLIHLDELEDFRYEITKHKYRVEDFRIKERVTPPPPNAEIFAVQGEIEITYLPTGRTLKLQAGHLSAWVVELSDQAKQGYFA